MRSVTSNAGRAAIGAFAVLTDQDIAPQELAAALEERGFESCFLGEHSHVPVRREAEDPQLVMRSLDPFIALTAMAMATDRLRVGTGVALIPQRDPIHTAKEVATLDLLSGGRVLLGVGAGWQREEMRNHGTDPETRYTLLRERVLAMKVIWTSEQAEFHGRLVDFDPIMQWPKPVQRPHPPVLIGGRGRIARRHLLEFGDGWMPTPGPMDELEADVQQVREEAGARGRGRIPVTMMLPEPGADQVARAVEAGADRVLLMLPSAGRDEVLRFLDAHAPLTGGAPS
jgi:probable F420-dependent oxidoreductase